MHAGPFRNTILRNLPPASVARLKLRPITLEARHAIETPGEAITFVYFLEAGIVSVTTRFEDGSEVEAGMFGYESVSGISAFMGTRESLNAAYMQIAGHGYASPVAHAAAEFRRGGAFQTLALRAVQAQLLQSMQSAGCNASHDVEQRLARWLLLCADRTETDTLALSQEFMGDMLGARRTTVTMAAGHFKDRGYITYVRGKLRILDRPGLESSACECYHVLHNHLHDIKQYDSGIPKPAA
jgi:CRP-like cAMP-binding protein